MLSGQQHSAVQVKRSLVKDQVREVIGGLEIVLGELKDVAKELKEVVSQIDTLTASLNLDEETDDSKCSTLNSSSSGNTGSSGGGAAAVARFSTTVSAARFSTTINASRFSTTVSAFASRTSASASVLTVLRKPRPPPPPPRTTPVSLPQLPFCEDPGQRGSSLEPTEQEEEEEEQGTVARDGGDRERKREVGENFCCQRRQFELSYTAVRQRTELVRDSASYQHDQSNHYYHHHQQHLQQQQQQHRYQHRQVDQHALKDRVRFNDLVEFSDLVEEEEEEESSEDPLPSVEARGHPLGQIVCNQSALQVEAMQLRHHHHQLHHHHHHQQQQQQQLACSVQLNAGALQALPPSGFVRDSRSISYHARDTTVIAHAKRDSEGHPPPKAILRKSKNTVV